MAVCTCLWAHMYACLTALADVSELWHAELGALDFEGGPWFCRFSCPSLESVFNYPSHCAKSEVSTGCQSPALSDILSSPGGLRGCVIRAM